MLRHFYRNFQCVLKLQQTGATKTTNVSRNVTILCLKHNEIQKSSVNQRQQYVHQNIANYVDDTIASTVVTNNTNTANNSNSNDNDDINEINKKFQSTDHEYIVPYHFENERGTNANELVQVLQTRFRLSNNEIEQIVNDKTVLRTFKNRNLIQTMNKLCFEGITKRTFIEYPWLLTLDSTRLNEKFVMLRQLAIRDINHFAPFLRLTVSRLRKLVRSMKREASYVPTGNRLYYISERMQTNPATIVKYIYNRLFILEMPFEIIEQNLAYMLEYNVAPASILRDLWAFRYAPRAVKTRLERAQQAKKDKIMPWMVRCPEQILQKCLQRELNERMVLGDKNSSVEYVAARLGFDVNETKGIMDRHPLTHNVRVTKVKEVLDYLLDKAGFTPYDIALVPRILCHSLETTKTRLAELKNIGCRPTTLIVVCRSKREYEKFVKTWLETQKVLPISTRNKQQLEEQQQTKESFET